MKIKDLVARAHENAVNKGFHEGRDNIAEKLMLIVSELGEALDAHRHGRIGDDWYVDRFLYVYDDLVKRDSHIATFERTIKDTFEDEIADAFIRLADLCGYLNIDIEKFIEAKMRYNETREYKHGKLY